MLGDEEKQAIVSALAEIIGLYREMVKSGLKRGKPVGQLKERALAKIAQWDKLLTALTNKE